MPTETALALALLVVAAAAAALAGFLLGRLVERRVLTRGEYAEVKARIEDLAGRLREKNARGFE